jgi:alpha-tubulin suppressor-like RCC1 family protein
VGGNDVTRIEAFAGSDLVSRRIARRVLPGLLVLGVAASVAAVPAGASPTPGAVYAWFDNDSGQLGIGKCCVQYDSQTPVATLMPSGTTSIATAAGQSHSLVVTSTGAVYAFGFNGRGQLGNGTKTNSDAPVQTSMPAGVTASAVAAGWDQSLALTSTGAVYAWGYNVFGQLGIGTTKNKNSLVPVLVHLPSGETVTAIAAGQYHCLALTSTGAVYAWGFNGFGQLGNGTTTNSSLPQLVPLPAGVKVTAVGAGDNHSLVVTSTGAVYAFGKNNFGQLGNGTTTNSTVPLLVQLPTGVAATAVVAGGVSPTAKVPGADYSLALTSTGAVYAWGGGGNGQLGTGGTTNSGVPVLTQLPTGVVATAIGAGPNFGHALTSTGDIYFWGAQANGKDQHLVPAPTALPSGLHGKEVSAGPDGEQILAIFAP